MICTMYIPTAPTSTSSTASPSITTTQCCHLVFLAKRVQRLLENNIVIESTSTLYMYGYKKEKNRHHEKKSR